MEEQKEIVCSVKITEEPNGRIGIQLGPMHQDFIFAALLTRLSQEIGRSPKQALFHAVRSFVGIQTMRYLELAFGMFFTITAWALFGTASQQVLLLLLLTALLCFSRWLEYRRNAPGAIVATLSMLRQLVYK